LTRRRRLAVAAAVLVILAGAFVADTLAAKELTRVANLHRGDIVKISFRLGSTGEFVDTTDSEAIDEFIGYLNGYRVRRKLALPSYLGWTYRAVFYSERGQVADITFNDPVHINRWLYTVADAQLDREFIGAFIETLRNR
jgi:hypothetical protein